MRGASSRRAPSPRSRTIRPSVPRISATRPIGCASVERRTIPLTLLLLGLLAPACSPKAAPPAGASAVIVVDAPLARAGLLAQQIVRGTQLAAAQINAAGGVQAGNRRVRLDVRVLDSEASPERSAANVREAVRLGAVAVVDEGTGVDASWQIANAAGIPIGIVYQG